MTPQRQTILQNKHNGIYGNCVITTYASYLDLDVDKCPQIQMLFGCEEPYGFWDAVFELWLKEQGYEVHQCFQDDPYETDGYDDYYFAVGRTVRDSYHQVIYKEGKLFWDPHYSDAGLESDIYFHKLVKIK